MANLQDLRIAPEGSAPFCARFDWACRARGVGSRRLAQETKIGGPRIAHLRRIYGARIEREELEALAGALRCDPDYLRGETDDPGFWGDA